MRGVLCVMLALSQPEWPYINLIAIASCRAQVYSFALGNHLVPPDVQLFFFAAIPSWRRARRFMRMAHSELWRQIRHLKDCLRVVSARHSVRVEGSPRLYQCLIRESETVKDFLWSRCLPTLCSWKRASSEKKVPPQQIKCLGDVTLTSEAESVLKCGPKFCCERNMQPVSLVSMVRKVASCVDQDNKDRCIAEGVEYLVGSSRRAQQCSGRVKNNIGFLRDSN